MFRSHGDPCVSIYDRNLFGIWYCDDDLSEYIQSETRNCLNRSFNYVRIFNDLCEFITYLTSPLIVTKIFFVITGKNAQYLCNIAKKRLQHEKVYQFQPTSSVGNDSHVYTDMNKLFTQISEDIDSYLNKSQSDSAAKPSPMNCRESIVPPPWSVWNSKTTQNSFQYWKKESPEFFLFQALTRILTRMTCDQNRSFAEMIRESRLYYIDDEAEVQKIDHVENTYKADDAIWHYTRDSFLFRLVGRAFRSGDFEHIFIFRRYIIDLHWELDKLIKEQTTIGAILRLYRGKKLCITVLQQLQDNIGALISMNGFLSTTYNQKTALEIFADIEQKRPGYESVLFEFCIDETTITRTYAFISWMSQFPEEEEVLFTIGSVWRIKSIQKKDDLYWIVTLSSCSDVDLRIINFFEELADDSTLLMLGDVLRELGQHIQAEKFYYKMLDEPTIKDETRVTLYYNIAMINIEQKKDPVALTNLHEAEKYIPKRVSNIEPLIFQPLYSAGITPSPIHIYNNMACLFQKKDNSPKALEYFRKALDVQTSDSITKATVYDNIGILYYSEGNYETALTYLFEAVKLAQDHASLAKFKNHYDSVNKHVSFKKFSIVKEV
jgi:tetratricopeptide (TPR) repeat protein